MSLTTNQLENELEETRALIRTLRDEIKVKLHLAGIEARQTWQKLDAGSEKLVRELGKASRETINAAIAELRRFNESMDKR